MKIGFIGTGLMGQGMAKCLIKEGHTLKVYNRTPEKTSTLVEAGAVAASSIADVAEGQEVVISMLGGDEALKEVVLGEHGLIASLASNSIHMMCGTHGVDVIREVVAAHGFAGQIAVAAPVLGRPDVAAAGKLAVITGGPREAIERCGSVFEAISRRTFNGGEDQIAATSMKIANNFLLGCAIEAMGEGFSLVRKYGVAPADFLEMLTDGIFSSPAYNIYGEIIAQEDYDRVGLTTILGLKDANLALSAAEAVQVPLPSGNVWRDRLIGAIAHGDGEKDWAVVAREQARSSGLE
jgi:3-hydroxyisobutyrate dehydrogenase-like beta-hydroxyacid dehydrogenase